MNAIIVVTVFTGVCLVFVGAVWLFWGRDEGTERSER